MMRRQVQSCRGLTSADVLAPNPPRPPRLIETVPYDFTSTDWRLNTWAGLTPSAAPACADLREVSCNLRSAFTRQSTDFTNTWRVAVNTHTGPGKTMERQESVTAVASYRPPKQRLWGSTKQELERERAKEKEIEREEERGRKRETERESERGREKREREREGRQR